MSDLVERLRFIERADGTQRQVRLCSLTRHDMRQLIALEAENVLLKQSLETAVAMVKHHVRPGACIRFKGNIISAQGILDVAAIQLAQQGRNDG